MNKPYTLGLELLRAHRGNQLRTPASGEDKGDASARAGVAAGGRDEILEHRGVLAARYAAAVVWILAAGGHRAIRRIRDDQVEARGLDAFYFFLPKVGAN